MKNPNGPYPGRQIFVGATMRGKPAFAYLVTGRSAQSRDRKATRMENRVIIGPVGNAPYDPLRHYTAIKWDNNIGLAVISNGIQTEAIFETYKLLFNTSATPAKSYGQKIMDGAGHEPDSLHTPRIAGIITTLPAKDETIYYIDIKTSSGPAAAWQVKPVKGSLKEVAVYTGSMENPKPFEVDKELPGIEFHRETPQELAEIIYEISAADSQGEDIRVCSIGAIRTGNAWELAIINRRKD
jgi:IMP cyclohydrolase